MTGATISISRVLLMRAMDTAAGPCLVILLRERVVPAVSGCVVLCSMESY
jgi:hypothetical protein